MKQNDEAKCVRIGMRLDSYGNEQYLITLRPHTEGGYSYQYTITAGVPYLYISRRNPSGIDVHGLSYSLNLIYADIDVYQRIGKIIEMHKIGLKHIIGKIRENVKKRGTAGGVIKYGKYFITDLFEYDTFVIGIVERSVCTRWEQTVDYTITMESKSGFFFTDDCGSFYSTRIRSPKDIKDCYIIEKSDYNMLLKHFQQINEKLTNVLMDVYNKNR